MNEDDLVEIEVDGLSAPVNKKDYEADSAGVEQSVRDARASQRLPEDIPEAGDYDSYLAEYGEDGEPDAVE